MPSQEVPASRTPALLKGRLRTELRWFVAAMATALIVLILALLLLIESFSRQDRIVSSSSAATSQIDRYGASDLEALERALPLIRSTHQISSIEVRTPRGVVRSGEASPGAEIVEVPRPYGTIVLRFERGAGGGARQLLERVTLGTILAAIGGLILLLLYVPRFMRPIEQMLEEAQALGEKAAGVDEARFLVETFRSTVERLRSQEQELKQLHEIEKGRADDLQVITSTLTRSLTSGFIAFDETGRMIEMNQAGREILAVPQTLDLPAAEQFIDQSAFGRALREAVKDGTALVRAEIVLQRAEEQAVVGLTTVPLRTESGRFLGTLALFTDLTPMRKLEIRLREMQALADLGEMSAGIAHEFRNSLSTILGNLKLARRSEGSDAERRIGSAEQEAHDLSGAVEALLNFAKPMQVDRRPIALKALMESIAARFEPEGVTLSVRGDEVDLEGDVHLLTRALENLVRNAVDAVRQAGAGFVQVEIHSLPDPVVVIRDNGVGFDPEELGRLLLPFQSGKPGGFGLGLPLARKIILLHGGTLSLTGQPGQGAVARVQFPQRTLA